MATALPPAASSGPTDYILISGLEQTIQQKAPRYLDPAPDLANIENILHKPLIIGEYGFSSCRQRAAQQLAADLSRLPDASRPGRRL